MGRNLVYRPGTLIASILLAVLTLPSLLGAAEADRNTGVKGSETPQTLMATYRHALAAKDWRTCFLCYDPKMRGDFLCRLFFALAITGDAELAAIVKKHRADEITIPDHRRRDRVPKELLVYKALQKRVDDLPQFVDEMCRRLDAMRQETFSELGDVREISIQGDRAIGYWTPPPVKPIGPAASSNGEPISDGAGAWRCRFLRLLASPMLPLRRANRGNHYPTTGCRSIFAKWMASGT